MNHLIYGAALSAASRLMNGEVEIDGKVRSGLESALKELEEVQRVVNGLSVHRPDTWFRSIRRLLHRSLDKPEIKWVEQWLERKGYTRFEDRLPCLWLELCANARRTMAIQRERDVIWRYHIGDEAFLLPVTVGRSVQSTGSRWTRSAPDVRLPAAPESYDRFRKAVAEFFWKSRKAVLLDYVNDSPQFIECKDFGAGYIGPMTELFETWERFRARGLRRCVLLQGTPGTGKSTFAREAAHRLSERTVFMTSAAAGDISASDWQLLLDMLAPDMVVIDDIDRLRDTTLESNLRMFEEHHCAVPYILFTSNDHAKLPRPMRRPGRIDQILRMDEPGEEVLARVIVKLAERERVEVPGERLGKLVNLALETSTAHIVELLRRAHVDGWDTTPLPNDITFGHGFVEKAPEGRSQGAAELFEAEKRKLQKVAHRSKALADLLEELPCE